MTIFPILLLFTSFLYYKLVWKPHQLHKKYAAYFRKQGYRVLEIPFQPFSLTFLQLYDYSESTTDGLKIVKQKYPHYDLAITNLMSGIFIDLINPELVREFFSAENFENYHKSKYQKDNLQRGVGQGIAFTEGSIWKMKRNVLNSAFNFDFIQNLTPKIAEICDNAFSEIEKHCGSEFECNIKDYTSKLAADVMLQCFFGQKLKNQKIQGVSPSIYFQEIMGDLNLTRGDFWYGIFGVKFLNLGIRKKDRDLNRKLKLYKVWGYELIRKKFSKIKKNMRRKKQPASSHNLIEALIRNSLKKKKNSDEFRYTYKNIFDEFNTFFLAGFDTVTNYLQMTIYLICQHPEVERKVREQIQQYMNHENYRYDNLKKMTYIDCVLKEVTRFYGPGNNIILREVVNDHYLKGVPITKGTFFGVNYMGMHYSQEYYEKPKEFRPDRWLNECNKVPSFAVGGFSGGPRSCIGKQLGKMQTKIGVIKFLKRYERVQMSNKKIEMLFRFLYQPKEIKAKLFKFNNAQII